MAFEKSMATWKKELIIETWALILEISANFVQNERALRTKSLDFGWTYSLGVSLFAIGCVGGTLWERRDWNWIGLIV